MDDETNERNLHVYVALIEHAISYAAHGNVSATQYTLQLAEEFKDPELEEPASRDRLEVLVFACARAIGLGFYPEQAATGLEPRKRRELPPKGIGACYQHLGQALAEYYFQSGMSQEQIEALGLPLPESSFN